MALAAGLGLYSVPEGGLAPAFRLAAAVAAGLMLLGASGLAPAAVAYSLALLGAEYLAGLAARGARLDLAAPVYGALLFLAGELAYAALDARRPAGAGGARRALPVLAVTAAGALAGYGLLALALAPVAGGLALTGAGAAAAVGAAVLAGRLARRA